MLFRGRARLFADLPDNGIAVLNADVPEYEALADMVQGRVLHGRNGSDLIFFGDATPTRRGTHVVLTIVGRDIALDPTLAGAFQYITCYAPPALRSRAVPRQRPSQSASIPSRAYQAGCSLPARCREVASILTTPTRRGKRSFSAASAYAGPSDCGYRLRWRPGSRKTPADWRNIG